jgi:hypothetical protein
MHDPVARERRPRGHDELGAAAAGERRVAPDIADAGGVHVRASEDGQHARRAARRSDVEGADAREGVRRAHEHGIGLAGLDHIGGEAAGAAHQIIILDARLVGRAGVVGL